MPENERIQQAENTLNPQAQKAADKRDRMIADVNTKAASLTKEEEATAEEQAVSPLSSSDVKGIADAYNEGDMNAKTPELESKKGLGGKLAAFIKHRFAQDQASSTQAAASDDYEDDGQTGAPEKSKDGKTDSEKSNDATAELVAATAHKSPEEVLSTAEAKDVQLEVENKGPFVNAGVEVKTEGGKPMITITTGRDGDARDIEKVGEEARIVSIEHQALKGGAAEKITKTTRDLGYSLKNTEVGGKMLHPGEKFKLQRAAIAFGPEMKRKLEDRVLDPASTEPTSKKAAGIYTAKRASDDYYANMSNKEFEEAKKNDKLSVAEVQEILRMREEMNNQHEDTPHRWAG
ncbi:MAG: hypothetical protein GY804_10380 [Alphaproteobacteria bacterium]|nr:hypothetical protein [Alphaproteobacteria bacterium]